MALSNAGSHSAHTQLGSKPRSAGVLSTFARLMWHIRRPLSDSRRHTGPRSGVGLHPESGSDWAECSLLSRFPPQRVQCEHSRQDARLQARVCPGHVVSVLWGTWKSLEIVPT